MHTFYVLVQRTDTESYVTLRKNGWVFVVAFTDEDAANTYHQTLEDKDNVVVRSISSTYLSMTSRAIMINGNPVLVSGNSAGENTLSTYAPTPTLYSCISSIWHYVQVDDKDFRTPSDILIVHLSASTLLAHLYAYFPSFNDHLINDKVKVCCIMFKDLISREEYVFTENDVYNLRTALTKSKAVRHIAEGEENDV
jgi:hypothetical protein